MAYRPNNTQPDDQTFTTSTGGQAQILTISHTSNTASSTAGEVISVAGSSAGDAYTTYTVTGSQSFTQGIDNSDSDAYVLAASTALGTTNVLRASTAGEVTKPLQPAFCAGNSSTVSDVTGDGTAYTIIFDTEIFDVNADYNAATGTFTAPVTGKYQFNLVIKLTGGTTIQTGSTTNINTSNNAFLSTPNYVNNNTNVYYSSSVLCDMDAADTATFIVTATDGSGKVDDLVGTSSGAYRNYVSGFLAC